MNRAGVLFRKKSAPSRPGRAGAWLLAAGVGLGLAGCGSLPEFRRFDEKPVDQTSAVAREVQAKAERPGPYPKFSDIPPLPTDVRPAPAWRAAVADVKADRAQLERQVAAIPPILHDSEDWAAQVRAQAEPPPPPNVTPTEDYARELRERVKPPPSPH